MRLPAPAQVLAHGAVEGGVPRGIGDYVGSPMYVVIAEHGLALVLMLLVPVAASLLRRSARRGRPRATRILGGYRSLPARHRLAAWLIALAAAAHTGLVFGHEPSGYTAAYALGAVAQWWLLRRLLEGRPIVLASSVALVGPLVAYAVSGMSGDAPDQLGILTKLIELTALAALFRPEGRLRRLALSTGIVTLTLLAATGAWIGAFRAGDGGHHLGEAPPPGVLIPNLPDREPTAAEAAATAELIAETRAAIAKYADPAVAAADGYAVAGIHGTDFHADNEAYTNDGHILDPQRPETLVYAALPDGTPVLLGAMFQVDGIGNPGPAIGGPLTVWHAHDHVCLSPLPPHLVGMVGPFGTCPYGAIALPITNEMIHVWTIDGAPEPVGDLDDAWLETRLDDLARHRQPTGTAERDEAP